MKVLSITIGLFLATVLISCNSIANRKTETFKVYGNCGMCKKTIEKSLAHEGIEADWNKNTKMIKVSYDSLKYTNAQINEFIAASGYDTEKQTGNDSAYNNLHECCKYERKK
jgi:mercuric ion binding protein